MMRRLIGIEGMACAGCARGLEGRLKGLPGMRFAGVHHLTSSALLDWDPDLLDRAAIRAAIASAGYVMVERHRPDEISARLGHDIRRLGLRLAVAIFAGMWSMAPALVLYLADLPADIAWWLALVSGIFALPVVFWAGSGILWMGWKSLVLRTPGMDLLISLGALAAVGLSAVMLAQGRSDVWFDTATMLVTLLLAGRLVDLLGRRSAIEALSAMEAASPETVLLPDAGHWQSRSARGLPAGTRFAVDAGAPVALDGIIETGESLVNLAVLTGESRLHPVGPGQRLQAGAINMSQRLLLRADRDWGARDIDLMGGAVAIEIARKGSEASVADRWAARLAVGFPLLALLVGVAGLFFGLSVLDATLRGLTVLVAGCPCALAIAMPLAELRAAVLAARQGLRLRDIGAFHKLAELRAIVFDKTGTLTTGALSVSAVHPARGQTRDELLALAARAETGIDHPIARALVAAHGHEEGQGGQRAAREARVRLDDGALITVGASRHPHDAHASWLSVIRDGQDQGQIALSDSLRPESAALVASLRASGIRVCIATGDGSAAGARLAADLNLSPADLRTGCTPAQKAAFVRGLAGPVACVGDGVNDAPALSAADCGISVASAHGAAAQTAAVVIMSGGLEKVALAIDLSRRLGHVARTGIMLAVGYNALILPLAALGLIGPEMAAGAMFLSSVSVMLNAMRLDVQAPDPSADE